MNKTIITMILLLTAAFTQVRAQQADRKASEGQSIRHRMFSDYDQAIAKIRAQQAAAPKAKEATLASPQAVKQHIFPGSNGITTKAATSGARKANTSAAQGNQLPSTVSAADAAQKNKDADARKAAAKPFDINAQGTEPTETKAKAPTPKN